MAQRSLQMGLRRIAGRCLIACADRLYDPSMLHAHGFDPRLVI
jgi:hypothetical protein